jgi:hypothetical protein
MADKISIRLVQHLSDLFFLLGSVFKIHYSDVSFLLFAFRWGQIRAHLYFSPPSYKQPWNWMPSEETPLLPSLKHETVYNRFSKSRKRVLLILVSWCGLIPSMSESSPWDELFLITLTKSVCIWYLYTLYPPNCERPRLNWACNQVRHHT